MKDLHGFCGSGPQDLLLFCNFAAKSFESPGQRSTLSSRRLIVVIAVVVVVVVVDIVAVAAASRPSAKWG